MHKTPAISGTIILLGMPLYTAAIAIGGARFIETTLNISIQPH